MREEGSAHGAMPRNKKIAQKSGLKGGLPDYGFAVFGA